MKYKFRYKSKPLKLYSNSVIYVVMVITDIAKVFIIDLLLILPYLFVLAIIYRGLTSSVQVPNEVTYTCAKVIILIELLAILLIEIKRRFTYCQIKPTGIYLYNNNGMKFGYGSILKRNALIRFEEILSCEKANEDDIPQTYWRQIWFIDVLRFIKKSVLKGTTNDKLPVIAHGDFSGECIKMELKNGKTVYIPVENIEDFLKNYEHFKCLCLGRNTNSI